MSDNRSWDLISTLIGILRGVKPHSVLNMNPANGKWRIVAPVIYDDKWTSEGIYRDIRDKNVEFLSGDHDDPDDAWRDAVKKHGSWDSGPVLNFGSFLDNNFVLNTWDGSRWDQSSYSPPVLRLLDN